MELLRSLTPGRASTEDGVERWFVVVMVGDVIVVVLGPKCVIAVPPALLVEVVVVVVVVAVPGPWVTVVETVELA